MGEGADFRDHLGEKEVEPGSTSSPHPTRVLLACLCNPGMSKLLELNPNKYIHTDIDTWIHVERPIYVFINYDRLLPYSQIMYLINQTQKWAFDKEKLNDREKFY